jgi:hypothetical protein
VSEKDQDRIRRRDEDK